VIYVHDGALDVLWKKYKSIRARYVHIQAYHASLVICNGLLGRQRGIWQGKFLELAPAQESMMGNNSLLAGGCDA
jgi:hypothetical protein